MKEHVYLITNLDCINCASKVEKHLNKNDDFSDVTIDFVNKKIYLKTTLKSSKIIESVNTLINQVETGVSVQDVKAHNIKSNLNIKRYLIYISGFILLLITMVLDLGIIFYIISYIMLAHNIIIKSFKNIKRGNVFDENFLMIIATIAAFIIGQNVEAVMIIIFYQIGEFFQDVAIDKSRSSIKSLLEIRPNKANKVIEGNITEIEAANIEVGDILLVKANEKIPADGIIVEGDVYVDMSALTGESLPVSVTINDEVISGSINLGSPFKFKVNRSFEDSYATKIIDMVENASKNKSNVEQFMTKFAKLYTPIVVVSAIVILVIQIFLLNIDSTQAVTNSIIFLVISCPCALVISIPLGYFGGVGLSSKNKILVKGSNYLEAVNDITDIVFDKTGTITTGEFSVLNIETNMEKDDFINIVASIESNSSHIIAMSIAKLKYDKVIVNNIEEIAGQGLIAIIGEDTYKVGNRALTNYKQVSTFNTVVYVMKNDQELGYIELGDSLKGDITNTMKSLKEKGIKLHILSGDNKKVVENVAETVGIDDYYGELQVHEKIEKLESILGEKSTVAYLGDGINDAPALVRSDIGISMGNAANSVAIESSDIVFISDNPKDLLKIIDIAKRTRRIVYQNITLALGVKIFFLVLALFGVTTIYEAIFADVGVSLLAILNATRLTKMKLK